ncbi:trimethylamine methyltransferase family protein [Candidatus Formimonas warabiya]|uniref:Trimethylamine methyltransferase n=1 Tax=Formimonas warabiya TaxID=1761012 RepID=A0A3G1KXK9_FORW1|nr:trimethylamine methyltransferase family protein [Candidatus Formimonas warabiya]ATW27181.1 hypothetical protein DCMF_22685 [Candidatus Formimonas warabiya]
MAKLSGLQILSQTEMEKIHEQSLGILEKLGVSIPHREGLKALEEAGATIDYQNHRAYIKQDLVEQSLKSAPKSFVLAGFDPQNDIVLPHPENGFYSRTGTGSQGCIDLETDTFRYVQTKDVEHWVRLIDKLEHIDICAVPTPMDTPQETRDIHAFKCALEYTKKHIMIQPYSSESLNYLCEMAVLVAGGKEELKKRPAISMVACCTSPLSYKAFDVDVIFAAGEYGLPVHVASLNCPGGSGPVTIAGSVLQSNAEFLAGLVLTQVISPGLPVIGVTQQLPLNMVNGIALQTSVEATLGNAAGVQLTKEFYGIPSRTYSFGSDALFGDSQSMLERTFLGLVVMLAKTDILSAVGSLEGVNTISLRQLVVDNDLLGMFKRLNHGVDLSEDQLAVQCIFDVVSGKGSFMAHRHTFEHCREIFQPSVFDRNGRIRGKIESKSEIMDRAKVKVNSILGEETQTYLPENTVRLLEEIVEKADCELAKRVDG